MHKFKSRLLNKDDCDKILKIADSQFMNHSWNDFLIYCIERNSVKIYFCETCNIKYLVNRDIYYDLNNEIDSYVTKKNLIKKLNELTCEEFIIKNIIE